MKFLDVPRLAILQSFLSSQHLTAHIEAYSCKPAGDDKRLRKQLERQLTEEIAADPVSPTLKSTPLGDLNQRHIRDLLINLIATLNASFTDYDFSTTKPEDFLRVPSIGTAMASINKQLADVLVADGRPIVDQLWGAIDEVITLRDCAVYTYIPDLEADPLSVDALWSFNYFFYNKSLNRLLYFFCVASNRASTVDDGEDDYDDEGMPTFDDGAGAGAGAGVAPDVWVGSQEAEPYDEESDHSVDADLSDDDDSV